jgi:hypothetical protein
MPAEILIMCPRCGRPQRSQGNRCVHCLAALSPVAEQPTGSQNESANEPFLEADLGLGRRVLLSANSLEFSSPSGASPLSVELPMLESVTLVQRPVWESLYIGALASLAFAVRAPWLVHALFGAVAVLALAACALQKRYGVRLRTKDGRKATLFLGIGPRRSPVAQRIQSVWDSLAPALASLGVRCNLNDAAADLGRPSARV